MAKDDKQYPTRKAKNSDQKQQREKNKQGRGRTLIVLFALLVVLIILLITWLAGGEGHEDQVEDTSADNPRVESSQRDSASAQTSEDQEEAADPSSEPSSEDEEDNQAGDLAVWEVEPADGAIVSYEGNWPPVGTTQTGEHVTNYENGSADRIEIRQAVSQVTGLAEDQMIEEWIGNDGTSEGVLATVVATDSSARYRVHLKWVDGGGWQPVRLDILSQ